MVVHVVTTNSSCSLYVGEGKTRLRYTKDIKNFQQICFVTLNTMQVSILSLKIFIIFKLLTLGHRRIKMKKAAQKLIYKS